MARSHSRQRRDDDDDDDRLERWLALLFGLVSGVLIGGVVGYTVGAGWRMAPFSFVRAREKTPQDRRDLRARAEAARPALASAH
jgi:hypothetical protein